MLVRTQARVDARDLARHELLVDAEALLLLAANAVGIRDREHDAADAHRRFVPDRDDQARAAVGSTAAVDVSRRILRQVEPDVLGRPGLAVFPARLRHDLVMLQRRRPVAARFGDITERVVRRSRWQQFEAALEVGDGAIRIAAFLASDAALQVVVEKAVAPLYRSRVIGFSPRVVVLDEANIAAERVKMRFAVEQLERLLGLGRRNVELLFAQRLAPFVVGLVRGLQLPGPGHDRRILGFALEAAGAEPGGRRAISLDTLTRRRMACEQPAEPVGLTTLAEADEGLLQVNRPLRVVARLRHVPHAVEVRFEFRAAAVLRKAHLREHAGAARDKVAIVAVARRNGRAEHADLHDHGARLLLGGMTRRGVHRLVAEHGSELRLRLELGQQPSVDSDLAAGQRPRIGHRVIEYDELVGKIHSALRGNLVADALHVRRQRRVDVVLAALRLLHGRVVLPAHLDFLGRTHEYQLFLSRDRVDRACCQESKTEQQ